MILASIPQLLWRSGFSDVLRWPFQKYFFGNVSRVDVLCGRAPGFSGHVPQTGLAGLGRTQATLRERLRSAWRGCSGLNALPVPSHPHLRFGFIVFTDLLGILRTFIRVLK